MSSPTPTTEMPGRDYTMSSSVRIVAIYHVKPTYNDDALLSTLSRRSMCRTSLRGHSRSLQNVMLLSENWKKRSDLVAPESERHSGLSRVLAALLKDAVSFGAFSTLSKFVRGTWYNG